ncbi:nitroreductase/quinone reductase family protein [Dactylosporangium sp. NPDC000521]|uniref:nitroreductase/quinone reductase family protein n=1 Tax=Dactylosporangium sp. NPDC000521 TaxID=3363975 RepID=UPI0036CAC370
MTTSIRPDGALDVEQLVLPGQTAAPGGPVDAAAMYVMHHAFRRDLALFTAATAATPTGDQACWKRLKRRWALFSGALHKHHHGEDSGLWPLLLRRTAGSEDAAVLRAMAAEHEHIDPLLQACGAGFAGLAAGTTGAADTREVLVGQVTELRDRLEAHLAHEERDAMALVQAHLTQHDWERLDKEHFAPQYGARDVPAVLAWVMHGLPPHAVRRIPGGPVLRAVGGLLVRRFARAERRTFHYVAPPAMSTHTRVAPRDRLFTWVSKNAARIHIALFRRSNGRIGHRFRGCDVLLLTVRGRRSGRQFTVPTLYLRDGTDYIVAASNGGIDREPQWWLNLLADPNAVVETRGERLRVTASEVQGEQRGALWARLVASLAAYEGYQAKVRRRIAVVRLRPHAADVPGSPR